MSNENIQPRAETPGSGIPPSGEEPVSQGPSGRATILGRLLTAAMVLLPAAPIVAGVALTSGAAGAARRASTFTPVKPQRGPARSSLPGGSGALVAQVLKPINVRTRPGGRPFASLGTRTNFGSPAFLWVVRHVPGWLGVITPVAGNGRIGWIPQSAAGLTRVSLELRVSLSAHKLTVLQGGSVLHQYAVAVGKPGSPTPTGRFDVTDRLLTGDPGGPYGCCILALSALAPHAIADWNGGDRVAIHSTPEASSIGYSVTHGCVRVSLDNGRWLLDHVPLGTPTVISA